ncbi:KH domain-containing protein 3-like [Microtus ochrogaster]|uniref:KH domain-containing protein 3-like n=1 Tax=Microtus ochrogaster TaxID=79684 RepID=A0ABM1AH80_MICOH|nr:KH domain-containing protein 3-like [Microtus ochrogaster]
MVPFKTYKSLVQLKHKEGTLFEVVGDSSTLPEWFRTEYLDDPKTLYVNPWFVEAIFGKDGEYIPHVESTSRTLLQVNHWHPEEDAEILIFGPPYYQEDVSQMISNLVNYFRPQMRQEEDLSPEDETQCLLEEVDEASTQLSPVRVAKAQVEVAEPATQQAPME